MRIEALLRARRPRVVTIRMAETVMAGARRLRAEDIGLLVVKDTCATEGEVVLGVLSERDILQAIVEHGTAALKMPVSSLTPQAAVYCWIHDTVEHAVALMDEHHVRHLPVLHDGTLIGVVSMRDLLALSQHTEVAASISAPPMATAYPN